MHKNLANSPIKQTKYPTSNTKKMEKNHHSLLPHSISIAEHAEGRPVSVKKEPPFHSALRSVQKPPVKLWKRPELHPQPPSRPKVYFVEPRGFRELVQRLTGAPKRSLKEMVQPPPPLELEPPPPPPLLPTFRDSTAAAVEAEVSSSNISKGLNSPGLAGFLSPTSFYTNWCSFPLLSPASMASLEHNGEPVL
ncbi:uncharacterized protein LOC109715598 [Ananas comosus]|uniref:Uncharacterized protein LOC109715598 n=1 Tax=Ananas comosus TaxID=4615 RepID=A0A6P5FKX3_ANACO|nr:uncharacterized protein LOC109715598 [Ananas comosus]